MNRIQAVMAVIISVVVIASVGYIVSTHYYEEVRTSTIKEKYMWSQSDPSTVINVPNTHVGITIPNSHMVYQLVMWNYDSIEVSYDTFIRTDYNQTITYKIGLWR